MYKSPIDIIYGQMEMQMEGTIMRAVQKVDVNVDKEELIRALQYDRGQYYKGYQDAMANQRWIPVTERLPEQGDVVLIYTKHEDIQVFQWDDNYGGWVGDRYNYSKRMVTHWMPLPDPPKEGADNG